MVLAHSTNLEKKLGALGHEAKEDGGRKAGRRAQREVDPPTVEQKRTRIDPDV